MKELVIHTIYATNKASFGPGDVVQVPKDVSEEEAEQLVKGRYAHWKTAEAPQAQPEAEETPPEPPPGDETGELPAAENAAEPAPKSRRTRRNPSTTSSRKASTGHPSAPKDE